MKIIRTFLLLLFCTQLFCSETKRVLVGSPIRQKPAILKEFLESLLNLDQDIYHLDYLFVDDNTDNDSKQLLDKFQKNQGSSCRIIYAENHQKKDEYICNEFTHFWTEDITWKVAAFKDDIINEAVEGNYDYLFLIDSDIVLHPRTITQLINAEKDIISNIFWTSWFPGTPELPQVWLTDHCNQYHVEIKEKLTPKEINRRQKVFLSQLRKPGVYEVGGLGACTLISKEALEKGVSFKRIKNITFSGEDRHFCIRAAAKDIGLYVDTHYPAYHIYRESALPGVKDYVAATRKPKEKPYKLTLSMIMRNEADRYLREMLTAAREYITDAVIIDDASTDNSVDICEEILKDIPHVIIKNAESKFCNEITLRKQQWQETIKTNPEWIIFLDADEIFESKIEEAIEQMLTEPHVFGYRFRLFDMWDESSYREDQYWRAHLSYSPFIIRYVKGMDYHWKETPQHCGRMPCNIQQLPMKDSEIRLKHLGWSKPEDRQTKFERYTKLDPDARYGWKEQYESILDEDPHLVKFEGD